MKWIEHNGVAINLELAKSITKVPNTNTMIIGYDAMVFSSEEELNKAYENTLKFMRDNVKGVLYI